jgi:hypothetical protein
MSCSVQEHTFLLGSYWKQSRHFGPASREVELPRALCSSPCDMPALSWGFRGEGRIEQEETLLGPMSSFVARKTIPEKGSHLLKSGRSKWAKS